MKPCNRHIARTLELADEMIELADRGDSDREDNGCGILYGILRDSAFKLKKLAEAEKQSHIRKGWWPAEARRDKHARPAAGTPKTETDD